MKRLKYSILINIIVGYTNVSGKYKYKEKEKNHNNFFGYK